MNTKITVQFLFFFLSFYCFGAGMMDSFVVYHGWKFVGVAEFAVVHEETGKRIVQVLVMETLLMTLMTILMLWSRPFNVSKKWIAAAFGCELISWVSSVIIQIPIQFGLHHKDEAALQRLLTTDWIRIAAWLAYIIIVSRMLLVVLRTNHNSHTTTVAA